MSAGRRPDGQAHFTNKGSCPVGGTRASQPLRVHTHSQNGCHRGKSSSSVGWRGEDVLILCCYKGAASGQQGQFPGEGGHQSPVVK